MSHNSRRKVGRFHEKTIKGLFSDCFKGSRKLAQRGRRFKGVDLTKVLPKGAEKSEASEPPKNHICRSKGIDNVSKESLCVVISRKNPATERL